MLVVRGRRGDRNVHSTNLIDLVVLDFRENDLFLDAQAVIAAAVERARVDSSKIADTGDRDAHQAIQELVHAVAAQRYFAADGLTVAYFERRHRLLGLGDGGLLARD